MDRPLRQNLMRCKIWEHARTQGIVALHTDMFERGDPRARDHFYLMQRYYASLLGRPLADLRREYLDTVVAPAEDQRRAAAAATAATGAATTVAVEPILAAPRPKKAPAAGRDDVMTTPAGCVCGSAQQDDDEGQCDEDEYYTVEKNDCEDSESESESDISLEADGSGEAYPDVFDDESDTKDEGEEEYAIIDNDTANVLSAPRQEYTLPDLSVADKFDWADDVEDALDFESTPNVESTPDVDTTPESWDECAILDDDDEDDVDDEDMDDDLINNSSSSSRCSTSSSSSSSSTSDSSSSPATTPSPPRRTRSSSSTSSCNGGSVPDDVQALRDSLQGMEHCYSHEHHQEEQPDGGAQHFDPDTLAAPDGRPRCLVCGLPCLIPPNNNNPASSSPPPRTPDEQHMLDDAYDAWTDVLVPDLLATYPQSSAHSLHDIDGELEYGMNEDDEEAAEDLELWLWDGSVGMFGWQRFGLFLAGEAARALGGDWADARAAYLADPWAHASEEDDEEDEERGRKKQRRGARGARPGSPLREEQRLVV
ncbi:hypothetical protein GGR56DRAFT_674207 [Xylariaceae sp. FL0804]|nr:hypothetical protein GGR56DRAFT_674207 [Xylariaceae sp. FL0804]